MSYKKNIGLLILIVFILFNHKLSAMDLEGIYKSQDIVSSINQSLLTLHNEYKDFTQIETIGYSTTRGTPLYSLKIGKGEKSLLINGAHHGRESMTAVLCLAQIENICKKYEVRTLYRNTDYRSLLDRISIIYVPLVNPDGVSYAMNEGQASWKENGYIISFSR